MTEKRDRAWETVAALYHAYTTGFLLTVITRGGQRAGEDLWFRVFRLQHEDLFLQGIEKLCIAGLPDEVKAEQYHYLSNRIGGVKVEYIYENDRKAWVRFVPPRWVYDGTAICAVPSGVSRALLRGWYGHNGVTLGNPRLGFVCTAQTMDAQHGLAGYFREYDHDLTSDERLIFSPGEQPPPFDPEAAPDVDISDWPADRLKKAHRNYAMNFTRTILGESAALFGPAEAAYFGRVTGQLIGMQSYDDLKAGFDVEGEDAAAFGRLLVDLGRAQDDPVEMEETADAVIVRQSGWRLMRGFSNIPDCAFEAWNGLWEGALTVHNRFLMLDVSQRMDRGDPCFEWRIRWREASQLP